MKIYNPDIIRKRLREYAVRPEPHEFSQKARGAVRILMVKALERIPNLNDVNFDETRYLVWGWLFCDPDKPLRLLHSADLMPQQWNALGHWETEKRDGEWVQRLAFEAELAWVLTRARFDYNRSLEVQAPMTFSELAAAWTAPLPSVVEVDDRSAGCPPSPLETVMELGGVPAPYEMLIDLAKPGADETVSFSFDF